MNFASTIALGNSLRVISLYGFLDSIVTSILLCIVTRLAFAQRFVLYLANFSRSRLSVSFRSANPAWWPWFLIFEHARAPLGSRADLRMATALMQICAQNKFPFPELRRFTSIRSLILRYKPQTHFAQMPIVPFRSSLPSAFSFAYCVPTYETPEAILSTLFLRRSFHKVPIFI